MNVVTLLGRLTKDPEVRYTTGENSMAVCQFTLAVDRQKKEAQADFIRCIAFGKTAEVIGKYVTKGRQLCISGHIQTGSYDNKEGQRVFTTDVVVDRMEFVGSRNDAPDNSGTVNEGKQMEIPDGFEAIDESEVPF